MDVPIFWDGDRQLRDEEVDAIESNITQTYSRALWVYICQLGSACDRVTVDGVTSNEWLFDRIVFHIDGDEYPWTPDDGFDVPEEGMAVAAALARKLKRGQR